MKAILGKKLGMTQVFKPNGEVVPVTVVEAGPVTVIGHKTVEKEGYKATVVAYEDVKEKDINKPEAGVFKKINTTPKKYIREFEIENGENLKIGETIKCDTFKEGEIVDVSGVSKGHGFSGNIKRHNAHRLRMTHGNGPCHRQVGSMNANSTPSRVFKNKKMPGQFGNDNTTILNLEVVKVDTKRNVLLIKGAIPGARGALVVVRNAVKVK